MKRNLMAHKYHDLDFDNQADRGRRQYPEVGLVGKRSTICYQLSVYQSIDAISVDVAIFPNFECNPMN